MRTRVCWFHHPFSGFLKRKKRMKGTRNLREEEQEYNICCLIAAYNNLQQQIHILQCAYIPTHTYIRTKTQTLAVNDCLMLTEV